MQPQPDIPITNSRSNSNPLKRSEEYKMQEKVKGKTEMVVEYVIRDKHGNIKDQGTEKIKEVKK